MKKIFRLSLAVFIVVLAAAACTSEPAVKTYGRDDKEINANAGDTFTIELAANLTTGYDWAVRIINDDIVSLVSKEYLPAVDTSIVGSGGVDVFTFKAVRTGFAIINLDYARSFEKDSTVETLTYIVNVE